MIKVKELLRFLLLAVMAGICIGIGGAVYLALSGVSKIAGAFFFSVGLTAILVFGLSLYTGMVGYLTEKKGSPWYLLCLLVVWLGNFAGTFLAAKLLCLSRLSEQLSVACETIVRPKLTDTWYSLLVLGFFCGVLMYFAVDTYKKHAAERPVLAVFAVVMGVAVFILAGFEHSIADMFYFALSGSYPQALLPLVWITLGNTLGGNLIPIVGKLSGLLTQKEKY